MGSMARHICNLKVARVLNRVLYVGSALWSVERCSAAVRRRPRWGKKRWRRLFEGPVSLLETLWCTTLDYSSVWSMVSGSANRDPTELGLRRKGVFKMGANIV